MVTVSVHKPPYKPSRCLLCCAPPWLQRQIARACVILTIACWPAVTQAFRCSQAVSLSGNADGPALSWPTRQVTYTLSEAGTAQLPQNGTLDTLRSAFAVWQAMTLSADANALCGSQPAATDLTFSQGPLSTDDWAGYDYLEPNRNTNLLVFRDASWTADPTNGDIIALTTTTYSALTGVILDADIEFNSANEQFALANPNDAQFDLLSTAVHEVGHFLGLAHCTADPTALCGHNEVMEPTALQGSSSKRQLTCDDRAGLVFKYGQGQKNGYCADASNCPSGCLPPVLPSRTPTITQTASDMGRGCAAASPGTTQPHMASVALVLLAGLIRRTRRAKGMSVLCVLAAPLMFGCQSQALDCGGNAEIFDHNAPLILSVATIRQIPSDPWHVLLALDFIDPDGDAGGGMLHYYANHSPRPSQSFGLPALFSSSGGLSLNATSGRIQLLVRLLTTTPAGAQLHLSAQMVDAAGHSSNCYGVDLKLDLQAADANVLLGPP